jgi:D-3-phosphoglycerate dehydrogenase
VSKVSEESELIPLIEDADAIAVNLVSITESVIKKLNRCKIIARYGVGYDNVDIEAAERAGIWVSNCQNYCNEETSDQAMALLLACVRKIVKRDSLIRSGHWTPAQSDAVFRLRGKTIGIIGFGGSGHAFARKIKGFEPAQILIVDPSEDPAHIEASGGKKVSFEALLPRADIISLHLPLNKQTRHLFNEATFKQMKPSAILINTSRGSIISEDCLVAALKNGNLGMAGLDVYEKEPLPNVHPLFELSNVVLSDHLGWYSKESFSELKTIVAKNIFEVLSGRTPLFPVNRPSQKT